MLKQLTVKFSKMEFIMFLQECDSSNLIQGDPIKISKLTIYYLQVTGLSTCSGNKYLYGFFVS